MALVFNHRYTRDGQEPTIRLAEEVWAQIVALARRNGWNPVGRLVGTDLGDWKIWSPSDAHLLLESLRRALPTLKPTDELETQCYTGEAIPRAPSVEEPLEQFFAGPHRLDLDDFMEFCRGGGFHITES
jgi:hypothetical protein